MKVLHLARLVKNVIEPRFWPSRFIAATNEAEGIENVSAHIGVEPYPDCAPDVVILYGVENYPGAAERARNTYPSARIIGVVARPAMDAISVDNVKESSRHCNCMVGEVSEFTATFRASARKNLICAEIPIRISSTYFYAPEDELDLAREKTVVTVATVDHHVPDLMKRRLEREGYSIVEITGAEPLQALGDLFRRVQYVLVPGFDPRAAQLALEASACGAFVVFHNDHGLLRKLYKPKGKCYRRGFGTIGSWGEKATMLKEFSSRGESRKAELTSLNNIVAPLRPRASVDADPALKRILRGTKNDKPVSEKPKAQ